MTIPRNEEHCKLSPSRKAHTAAGGAKLPLIEFLTMKRRRAIRGGRMTWTSVDVHVFISWHLWHWRI